MEPQYIVLIGVASLGVGYFLGELAGRSRYRPKTIFLQEKPEEITVRNGATGRTTQEIKQYLTVVTEGEDKIPFVRDSETAPFKRLDEVCAWEIKSRSK
jgi:hypothetical protein